MPYSQWKKRQAKSTITLRKTHFSFIKLFFHFYFSLTFFVSKNIFGHGMATCEFIWNFEFIDLFREFLPFAFMALCFYLTDQSKKCEYLWTYECIHIGYRSGSLWELHSNLHCQNHTIPDCSCHHKTHHQSNPFVHHLRFWN